MNARLRSLSSPDIDNLKEFSPDPPNYFCIQIDGSIGPSEGLGEELFSFIVCSPYWLIENEKRNGPIFGRGYLILNNYNFTLIWEMINELCARTSGSNWREIGENLAKYSFWEFDDYRP